MSECSEAPRKGRRFHFERSLEASRPDPLTIVEFDFPVACSSLRTRPVGHGSRRGQVFRTEWAGGLSWMRQSFRNPRRTAGLWNHLSRIAGTNLRHAFPERNGMVSSFRYLVLAVAAIPSIYYLIALFSSWRFFRRASGQSSPLIFLGLDTNL